MGTAIDSRNPIGEIERLGGTILKAAKKRLLNFDERAEK